ncbi:hypothetical protein ACW5CM_11615 [Microbacterium sp. A588]
MADSDDRMNMPSHLDRAIIWSGVGAATALAALLLMFGAFGFASSEPRADNVGEEGIGIMFGVVGWAFGLLVALLAGSVLARCVDRRRWWLRLLPALVSVAWMLLAQAAMYGQWFEGAVSAWPLIDGLPSGLSLLLWPFLVFSIYTLGAVPIGIALLIIWIVLIIRGRSRSSAERQVGTPTPVA